MKKVFFLAMVMLLVVNFAIVQTTVKAIAQDDLKDLKGEWTGERTRAGLTARTDLKIYNDSLPLRGEVVLHYERQAPKTWRFNNGRFENGRLTVVWSKHRSMDLRFRKKGAKMKLKGDITARAFTAAVSFKKVEK